MTSFIGYINYNNNVNTWCGIIYLQLFYWKSNVKIPIIIRYVTTTKRLKTNFCVCYITRRVTSIYNECSYVIWNKLLEGSCNENKFKWLIRLWTMCHLWLVDCWLVREQPFNFKGKEGEWCFVFKKSWKMPKINNLTLQFLVIIPFWDIDGLGYDIRISR